MHLFLEAICPGQCGTAATGGGSSAMVCAPGPWERERWSEGERSKGEIGEEGRGGGSSLSSPGASLRRAGRAGERAVLLGRYSLARKTTGHLCR